ncbi:MAG: hypothetical protein ACRD0X_06055, partial [Thermoanaerobaculia bacterium]
APPRPAAGGTRAAVEELAAVWRQSSLQMSALARANGARYFHFLQPNQYVAGSKPMAEAERRIALAERSPSQRWVARVYPRLIAGVAELRAADVAAFDLTRIFAAVEEPLYTDNCCHFSDRGYRILGRAMADAIAAEWGEAPIAAGGRR